VSAFEQSLVNYAVQIANEYPTAVRNTYVNAARNLRAPYWDWAADYRIPDCAAASTISVYMPGGSSVVSQSITNPLLSYRFPSNAAGTFGTIVDAGLDSSRTVRCSASAANAELSGDNLKDQVYSAFTRSTSFAALSVGTSSTVMPLEQPHNAVHVDAACGNHFSTVGAAGFDPLFMLNHCNVDRLWALWQEIYSTSIPGGLTTGGSWSIASGSSFTSSTQLSPFRRTSSTRWTPNDLYDTTRLGYTYTGIDLTASSSTRRSNANTIVNRLYSPTGSGSGGGPVNTRRPRNPRRPSRRKRAAESTYRYFAKVTVDTNKLNTFPISMKFYFNDVIAGCYTLLNAPADTIAKGEVPLRRVLEDQGYSTGNQTQDDIEDQIEAKLKVVFLNPDNSVIDPESVKGAYTFEVESAELIPNVNINELPKYGASRRRVVNPDALKHTPQLSYPSL
jgi:tyrosinase